MKLTPEQIQAKLDSFNKEYKESGLTDGKISREAARQAAVKAGAYKKTEEYKKAIIAKYGTAAGNMGTEEAKEKRKATIRKRYGSSTNHLNTPEVAAKSIASRKVSKKWKEGHKRSLAACHTPEAKAKAAAKIKKPILQYDLENNFLKEWPGIIDIQNTTGIHRNNIWMCLKGKTKTCKGFIWKYKLD